MSDNVILDVLTVEIKNLKELTLTQSNDRKVEHNTLTKKFDDFVLQDKGDKNAILKQINLLNDKINAVEKETIRDVNKINIHSFRTPKSAYLVLPRKIWKIWILF